MESYEPTYQSRREHDRGFKLPALGTIGLILLLVIIVMMICLMLPTSASSVNIPDLPASAEYTTAQSRMLSMYTTAQDQAAMAALAYRNFAHEEWVVEGTGSAHLDQVLTFYNCVAYHTPELIAEIYEAFPDMDGACDYLLEDDFDMSLIAAGLIGNTMFESYDYGRGGDALEGIWNDYATWEGYTLDQKYDALWNNSWYAATYGGGHADGSWGYGFIQWTWAGSRGALADYCKALGLDPADPVAQAGAVIFECGMMQYAHTTKYGEAYGYRWKRIHDSLVSNNAQFNYYGVRLATIEVARHRVNGNYGNVEYTMDSNGRVTSNTGHSSDDPYNHDFYRQDALFGKLHKQDNNGNWYTRGTYVNNGYGEIQIWDVLEAYDRGGIIEVLALKGGAST